jgi:hypothetical protein
LTGAFNVARAYIRHQTERQRLQTVERVAAKHGVAGVSTIAHLLPAPDQAIDTSTHTAQYHPVT